jgi:hypothetical protein
MHSQPEPSGAGVRAKHNDAKFRLRAALAT